MRLLATIPPTGSCLLHDFRYMGPSFGFLLGQGEPDWLFRLCWRLDHSWECGRPPGFFGHGRHLSYLLIFESCKNHSEWHTSGRKLPRQWGKCMGYSKSSPPFRFPRASNSPVHVACYVRSLEGIRSIWLWPRGPGHGKAQEKIPAKLWVVITGLLHTYKSRPERKHKICHLFSFFTFQIRSCYLCFADPCHVKWQEGLSRSTQYKSVLTNTGPTTVAQHKTSQSPASTPSFILLYCWLTQCLWLNPHAGDTLESPRAPSLSLFKQSDIYLIN